MRVIKINRRQARMLRDNLTQNQEGYDYTDLLRLDHLARRLTELQGDYAVRMAELAREEKAVRREGLKIEMKIESNKALGEAGLEASKALTDQIIMANKRLALMGLEVADLHEEAETVDAELLVEDGDWKLINDKLSGVQRWMGGDEIRPLIIGMMEAVAKAPTADASRPAGDNGVIREMHPAATKE